jgi:hypothetical protein
MMLLAPPEKRVKYTTALPVGDLIHDGPATPEQIALFMDAGGVDQSCTATCRYRRQGDVSWTTGHPLYRIQPSYSSPPDTGDDIADAFAWPILGLTPETTYEVEVTATLGGSSVVKTLTHTTASLPAEAGAATVTITAGSSAATIQAAFDALVPGDVLLFEDGTYDLSALSSGLEIDASGTSGQPIYIRGASRDGVVLTKSSGQVLYVVSSTGHFVLENFTIEGSGVDSGTSASSVGVLFWDGVNNRSNITIRGLKITGVDQGIGGTKQMTSVLVYNNELVGNNLWTTTYTDSNLAWNDDGIRIGGKGNCAFNNTLTGFGDSLSCAYSEAGASSNDGIGIYFYRNEVVNSCDDFIEADYTQRNCACYDNRGTNVMTAVSFDPLHGGPFVYARNALVNVARNPFKFNSGQGGYFLYNNTIVMTTTTHQVVDGQPSAEAGWYQANNGAQRSYGYRNNVLVYRGSGTQLIRLDNSGHSPVDWSHNAWYPDATIIFNGSTVGANLAAAYANVGATVPVFSAYTKRLEQDVITVSDPFETDITLGANYRTEVTTRYTPSLSDGDAAKNTGVAIANITDGYSGAAPDRGAIIDGRALVVYGRPTLPAWYSDAAPAVNEIVTIPGTASSGFKLPFSGIAYRPDTGELFRLASGGHADSSNNGVNRICIFDDAPAWAQRRAAYGSPIQMVAYYAAGEPSSRHTYWQHQWIAQRSRFMTFGARFVYGAAATSFFKNDGYNPATDVWDAAGTWGDPSVAFMACQDPATGDCYGTDENSIYKWTQATDSYSQWRRLDSLGLSAGQPMVWDPVRSHIFALSMGNGQGGSGVRAVRATAAAAAAITLTGLAAATFAADTSMAYSAMEYDIENDCYLFLSGYPNMTIYKIVPNNTTSWPISIVTTTGDALTATAADGVCSRWKYVHNLNGSDVSGFIYVPGTDGAGNGSALQLLRTT